MHALQEKLLQLISGESIGQLTLREIGEKVGEKFPQKIKHHLSQLQAKGFITIDSKSGKIDRIDQSAKSHDFLLSVPILGSANCGAASIYADENIEGYLKISKTLLTKQKHLFAIRAQGQSLNRSNINGNAVESGDYIIIDSSQTSPRDNDYVLCVIDGLATVKKFRKDSQHERLVLLAESTQNFTPIFIHQNDDFKINGKAIDVVKKFK